MSLSQTEFLRALAQSLATATDLGAVAQNVEVVGDGFNLQEGERVVIRADLDVPLRDGAVVDDARLEASAATLATCAASGCRVVVLGHIGRSGGTLEPVVDALARILGRPVRFLSDWLDEDALALSPHASQAARSLAPGEILVLENVRRYGIEQRLWSDEVAQAGPDMFRLACTLEDAFGRTYVNEAIAASNRDFSAAVLPLAMTRRGLGSYLGGEIPHLASVQAVDTVVMGGLKADKLDDLERICGKPNTRRVIVSGTLAVSLLRARANLDGTRFPLGRAGVDADAPYFASPARILQAEAIVRSCRSGDVDLVLPDDFVLDDGRIAAAIPDDGLQLDIGPASRERFAQVLKSDDRPQRSLFYNGVPGKFEDADFAGGTQSLVQAVEAYARAGGAVYVGGGEGRSAFTKYADTSVATHVFTAGGTVLKAVSGRPLPMLNSLLQNVEGACEQ